MEENVPVDQDRPFVWVVYSMKRLKLGAKNLVPKFLLVGEGVVSIGRDKLYTPFNRITALNI
ncbi:MAG: hypothetical protein KKH41_07605 [Candidatus Thermoplasmatota archaeon]|nr:hypothetical protein [Euryarchaeota archaeon]MBU4031222.1 hypothetical protein [Candidatus Thermoplasmatota archaeon]MBU4071693.1 hypothetical protein [Candidatus Thermoplasmatota archaeon]MBU4143751.1 hypothetical protein [Candidatus Thermoplasmatota archaeon]MBU4592434.1 hypothetical protein [Candidatus Thermoplasmatota archaeon]